LNELRLRSAAGCSRVDYGRTQLAANTFGEDAEGIKFPINGLVEAVDR
jgi:hypothetical protein